MSVDPTMSFLGMEHLSSGPAFSHRGTSALFVSINPDLATDFGHYLNYERRMQEQCEASGLDYFCLASSKLEIKSDLLRPVFDADSGHFSLTRSSAAGQEAYISREFYQTIQREIGRIEEKLGKTYDRIYLFMYCGSSLLASKLCDFLWPARMRVSINAFWDFLQMDTYRNYPHLARIQFQHSVRLLAMSELHAGEMRRLTGLSFACCANPPPLLSDSGAYDTVRAALERVRPAAPLQVLVPGLMTMGKGRELTLALYEQCVATSAVATRFLFRDRKGTLSATSCASVETIRGDLTDKEIQELYTASDIALLPYEAQTFSVRTSGALVDCLMFGVVPVVIAGTWLADVCTRLDFGRVIPEGTVASLLEQVHSIQSELCVERTRVLRAAARYLNVHSWGSFMERVLGSDEEWIFRPDPACTAEKRTSLFSAANRLHREGRFQEALLLYTWLVGMADLGIYRWNLARCESHIENLGCQVNR